MPCLEQWIYMSGMMFTEIRSQWMVHSVISECWEKGGKGTMNNYTVSFYLTCNIFSLFYVKCQSFLAKNLMILYSVYWSYYFNHIHVEEKVITIVFATSIEPGQPALLCSMTRLYIACWPVSSSNLNIPKNDNGQYPK